VSAEKLYLLKSEQMNQAYLDEIAAYYENWNGQDLVDLNFRFIKILTRTADDPKPKWYFFHDLVNKRRITNSQFPELVRRIIDNGIYPLRMFMSSTEWLAPNEVWRSDTARIIRSGFIPYENDDDLPTSIQAACALGKHVQDAYFIYTGNKSIHIWVKFAVKGIDDKDMAFADRREKAELDQRYKEFYRLKEKIPFKLDKRVSTDTRRVVPIPYSLNSLTGRKVIEINGKEICSISSNEVIHRSNHIKLDEIL